MQLISALGFGVAALTPLLIMMLLRHTAERLWPAYRKRERLHGVGLAVGAALLGGQALAVPALGGLTSVVVNSAGGGWLRLPTDGPGWWGGLAVYILAMDLGEYLFHRAQHAIPTLWSMHSLHHSDRAFDSTTAARHFWLEPAIKTVTIWLAVALLLKTPRDVIGVYIVVSYYHYLIHSNTRLDFGMLSWMLNSPGYHRLHHSQDRTHHNKNFASLFPVFDLLSGAYRRPKAGERLQTGLDSGEEPETVRQALTWPMRGFFDRCVAAAPLLSEHDRAL